MLDGLAGCRAAVVGLPDSAEDEHVVVHREAEQDHEQEDRQPVGDTAVRLEAQQALAPAPLEDGDEHAEGRADREQVEDDRLEGDHNRAERDQQQSEGENQDESEHDRRLLLEERVLVGRGRGAAGDGVLRLRKRADRGREQVVAQGAQGGIRF